MLIVFDLDGTLIDSRRDLADAGNAMLQGYGAPPLDQAAIVDMVGEGAAVLVGRLLQASGLQADPAEALERFLACYDERLIAHTHAYDGIPEALAELQQRATLAVLTNKPSAATGQILDSLGLRAFFRHVTGGDGPCGRKPDPAGLHAIMQGEHASPRETVVVGDSWVDLETARNAGARVCLARYGFGFHRIPVAAFRGDEMFVDHASEIAARLR